MPQLDPVPVRVVLDSAGDIESGALLYVYTAGTTTPVTTYQDAALSTAHASPVVADSSGRFAEIYAPAGNYKIDLRDAEGSSLPGYPRDNISLTASGVTTGATYGRAIQISDDYSDTDAWTIESAVGITARAQSYDSTTQLFDDPFVLEFAGDASDATNKVESAASVVTVTPGQELRLTAPIYATGSPTSTFEIGFEWYTSAGASISESVQSYQNSDITTGQVLHGYKVATAPSTAAMARIIGQRKTASVTGNWYMGAARLEIAINVEGQQAALSIDDLITLTGVAEGSTDLGTFTGSTISDNGTIKAGMQELETAVEAISTEYTFFSEITTTGTTSVTQSSIPASATEVILLLNGVSLSGTDNILVQVGDSGGLESTEYEGNTGQHNSTTSNVINSSSGFPMNTNASGGNAMTGSIHLQKVAGSNQWIVTGSVSGSGANNLHMSLSGDKTTSAALDRVALLSSGSDTFDAMSLFVGYR